MDNDLRARLQDAWQSARTAWPDVEVALDRFAAFVLEHLEVDQPSLEAMRRLNVVDLYLACACLDGVARALDTFDRVFMARVPGYLRSIDSSPAFADDVCQHVRERVFVGTDGAPKLAGYSGRGALASWLRMVALRTALNLRETSHPERNHAFDEAVFEPAQFDEPELDYIKMLYRAEFEAAVRAALVSLAPDKRRVLRLHLVGGLSTVQLGAMLNVNQSTIVRWLATARELVRTETHKRLRQQLGLATAEFNSLGGLLLSRLDLSIESCLRDTGTD